MDAFKLVKKMPYSLRDLFFKLYDEPEEALYNARVNYYKRKLDPERYVLSKQEQEFVDYYMAAGTIRMDIDSDSFVVNRLYYYFILCGKDRCIAPIGIDHFYLWSKSYAEANRQYEAFQPTPTHVAFEIYREIERIIGDENLAKALNQRLYCEDREIDLVPESLKTIGISTERYYAACTDLSFALKSNKQLIDKIGRFLTCNNTLEKEIEGKEKELDRLKEKLLKRVINNPSPNLKSVRKVKHSVVDRVDEVLDLDKRTLGILKEESIETIDELYFALEWEHELRGIGKKKRDEMYEFIISKYLLNK